MGLLWRGRLFEISFFFLFLFSWGWVGGGLEVWGIGSDGGEGEGVRWGCGKGGKYCATCASGDL